MKLTKIQEEQLKKQLINHTHQNYVTNIRINENLILKDFAVYKNVMRPEIMTSIKVAEWLSHNSKLYQNKDVLDMGCGSGILGLVMGINNAKCVYLTDISTEALLNTKENIKKYNLENMCTVKYSDIFKELDEDNSAIKKFDVIIFNHPYFPISKEEYDPRNEFPVLGSMLGGENLIKDFLNSAKKHMNTGGIIIMSYYHLLGEINNPEIQGKKHGYKISEEYSKERHAGLQQGKISIYTLRC